MFRNNKLATFRADYNYIQVDKKQSQYVENLLLRSDIETDILEGSDHDFYGFYLNSELNEAQGILKTFKVKCKIHQKATQFFGESNSIGLDD